ncbi:hypothetical protein CPB85DRAFT_996634 [Mucidula mucida]|nr:hypothetical protein CPB85DRAFT_996634 [Mucidula mucida]
MHTTSRRGNSSSRSPQISKGGACLNCRHRKIRCDGKKPSCSQCESSEIFHDCEYAGRGVTKTQVLEDQIAAVERRIQELENPGQQSGVTPIVLSQPYAQPQGPQTLSLPLPTQHAMLQSFLSQCYNLAFFLDVSRFTQGMLSPSSNPADRPIPALHLAALLWGIHLSPSQEVQAYEGICLADVVQNTAQGLASSVSHPYGVIQYIQAEVLVAQYFFRAGKILEGKYHTSAAAALVLSSGLHKFNPTSNDFVAEGERINGMWTVFMLNNCWTAADGSASNFSLDMEGSRIDAPWPMEMMKYAEISQLPPRTTYTIQKFLAGDSDYGNSLLAFEVKASLLFEQAGRLGEQYHSQTSQWDASGFFSQFNSFSAVLEKFIQNLPPVNAMPSPSAGVFVHSLAQAAVLALHMPVVSANPASRPRMVTAVRGIVQLLNTPVPFVDAVLGVVWGRACQFLLREISTSTQEEPMALLNAIIRVMNALAPSAPFIAAQLNQVQSSIGPR